MKKFLILLVAMMVTASLSGAAVITFNNQANWQTTVGAWTLFPFSSSTGLCLVCAAPSSPAGTTVTATVSGNNNYSGFFSINSNGVFQDVLTKGQVPNQTDPSLSALSTTTFTWSGGAMSAVGGLWDTSPVSEGGKINIVLNLVGGGTTAVSTLGPINGFFGWVSDVAFTSFTLSTNNNLTDSFGRPYGVEHYTLDNLQIATVPEPATLSIMGLGLLGLGVALRRYRRS